MRFIHYAFGALLVLLTLVLCLTVAGGFDADNHIHVAPVGGTTLSALQPCCGPFWGPRTRYMRSFEQALAVALGKLGGQPIRSPWAEQINKISIDEEKDGSVGVRFRLTGATEHMTLHFNSLAEALLFENFLTQGMISPSVYGPSVVAFIDTHL